MRKKIGIILILLLLTVAFSNAQDYTLSRKDTSDVQYLDGKRYYILKVDRSETLYGISRRFKVTQDELIKVNPSLRDGLKAKMKLWIPAPALTAKKAEEKEKPEKEKVVMKQLYNVSVFLPLHFPGMESFFAVNDSNLTKSDNETEARNNLEFYEGIEHAVDTLTGKDCRIHLSVYDTYNDSMQTSLLLKGYAVKEADFIIVESNANLLRQFNRYSTEHHIPLFTFSPNSTETLKGNPYGYALQPSSFLQCEEGGRFAAEHFGKANSIAIKTSGKENERSVAFQTGWNNAVSENKARIIDYTSVNPKIILSAMIKGKNNVLFIPSSNEDIVNPILSELINHKDEYQMTIIGLPTWQYFESIDMEILENLNTYIFTASQIHKSEAPLEAFRLFFRNEYLTEPSDAAMQGYDLMMLIVKNFMNKKTSETKNYSGLCTNYIFPETKNVHENKFISVLQYKNYELEEVK